MPGNGIEWGSVADWVSGLGSLAAVVTALWLARSSQKIRLDASAGLRLILEKGRPDIEVLAFKATNLSVRTTTITTVIMCIGKGKKAKNAIVNIFPSDMADRLPITLADGETARWHVPIGPENDWLVRLTSRFVGGPADVNALRFGFSTSNGGEIYAPLEGSLKARLLEVVAAQAAATPHAAAPT